MTTLTSRTNPKIKFIRKLWQHKYRAQSGLFIAEGIHHVGEALAAGAHLAYLCFAPDLLTSDYGLELIQKIQALGVECLQLSADLFTYLSGKENPQGILVVVHQPETHFSQLNPTNFPWCVALVAPQDPGNIGTILRTIDAVGASGLLLLDESADLYHPSTVRASMGTIFWYPLVRASFADFSSWSAHHAYHVYGTSSHASLDYTAVTHYDMPLILLMGSEREGLAPEHIRVCQELIHLPMHGHATSLNLAVSTAVLLYDILSKP